MVITWSTLDETTSTEVQFGLNIFQLHERVNGTETKFLNTPNTGTNVQYIHRVHLVDLLPNTTYYYTVGGTDGWSPVYGFKTFLSVEMEDPYPLRLAVFGDMGVINARSLTRLQEEAHQGFYDAAIHVGDFAYNMDDDNGVRGDTFMDQMEPLAAYLPYMTCPGNHENADDFHQYRKRFSMPNYQQTESLYHSFNIGPVHFIAVDTEYYYYDDQLQRVQKQIEWLESDLKAANEPDNRRLRPWIIIFGHRPMYCSPYDSQGKTIEDCVVDARTRVGIKLSNGSFVGNMEDLLWKYDVDLAIWAHEHDYERLYPMYNYTFFKEGNPYHNPRAPTHIISGSAGCQELEDKWHVEHEWSAVRTHDYGYTRINLLNNRTLYLEQVNDKDGSISDSVTIIRDTHKYPPLS